MNITNHYCVCNGSFFGKFCEYSQKVSLKLLKHFISVCNDMCITMHIYIVDMHFILQLYPFGLAYNDRLLPPSDASSSPLILLSDDFIFFKKRTRKIYVRINV